MAETKLIRNKSRATTRHNVEAYQPEYVRMDLDPVAFDPKTVESFNASAMKARRVVASKQRVEGQNVEQPSPNRYVQQEMPPPVASQVPSPNRRPAPMQRHADNSPIYTSPPQAQMGAYGSMSGFGTDWFSGVNPEAEEERINQETFPYEDVPIQGEPPTQEDQVTEPDYLHQQTQGDHAPLLSVEEGEYCIVVGNDVWHRSVSPEDIEQVLESIFFEMKVSYEEVAVFRRTKLRVGVCVTS
jgi:hypothetical protein